MTTLDIKKIIEESEKDFERAWVETTKELPQNTTITLPSRGVSHPLRNIVQLCRKILLEMGFSETENRTIIPQSDVYKQYGSEAPIILDRSFYLAKLPRPDIGISEEKRKTIRKIIGKFDVDILSRMLRLYKKGEIESDDLVEEMVVNLSIKSEEATQILTQAFPELKEIKALATTNTLRSHMTAGWYSTISALQDKSIFPLALFSIGQRYRNEQREDNGHLRVHNSTSIVVTDPNMSLEAGKKITLDFLLELGFNDALFETKKATSKYYANGLEQEVFAKWGNDWLEIGDIGMYSPISLAKFGIKYPVFNAGFGVERLTMIIEGYKDIRELVFPQFFRKIYTDGDIKRSIIPIKTPKTKKGKKIAENIEAIARINQNEFGDCSYTVYEDNEIIIEIFEDEPGKKLVGPAAFNQISVNEKNIISTPPKNDSEKPKNSLEYIHTCSLYLAAQIEESIEEKIPSNTFRIKHVKSLRDVNLQMPSGINEYITGHHGKIKIRGPVFLSVRYRTKS